MYNDGVMIIDFKLTKSQLAIMARIILGAHRLPGTIDTREDMERLTHLGLAKGTGHADLSGESYEPTPFALTHFYIPNTYDVCHLWTQGYEQVEYTPKHNAYRDKAKECFARDGEVEIDDNAAVHMNDEGGAYIQAWMWLNESDVFGEHA